ncbi:MAG: hypothetical protein WBV28_17175, partial [Terracidiphilus sp.]
MEVSFPRLRHWMKRGTTCEQGNNLLEVALLCSLIGLGTIAGMRGMANGVQHAFGQIAANLANIFDNSNFGAGDD